MLIHLILILPQRNITDSHFERTLEWFLLSYHS